MDEYTKDLYTMMFRCRLCKIQGITIRETVYKKSGQITVME